MFWRKSAKEREADQAEVVVRSELSDQEKERMRVWWEKWDEPKCPICQNQNWDLPKHVTCLRLGGGNLVVLLNGSVSPFFMIHCMTCGYAMFVNALASRVVVSENAT